MIKKITISLIILIFYSCTGQQNQSSQNEIRIISLAPNITEIIYALHADSNLVAVTDFCKYPPQVESKQKTGGLLNPNIEKMVSLKPTHLFGLPSHEKLDQQLSKFGLSVIILQNETIDDVIASIKIISQQLNISDSGNKLVKSIKDPLSKHKNSSTQQNNLKAMLIIGKEKGNIGNITVAGPHTYLDEIWTSAGGVNIFSDLNVKYSQINIEEILKRNPDVIIQFDTSTNNGILPINPGSEWQVLADINAVKNKHIYLLSADYTLIPGPRMVNIIKDFNEIIQLVSKGPNK